MRYNPRHEVNDPAKTEALKASLSENGWQGAPLVAWDDWLITGTHRYAACRELEIEPEVIDLTELFAAEGLDFEGVWREEGEPAISEVEYLLGHLSHAARERYGIEL